MRSFEVTIESFGIALKRFRNRIEGLKDVQLRAMKCRVSVLYNWEFEVSESCIGLRYVFLRCTMRASEVNTESSGSSENV